MLIAGKYKTRAGAAKRAAFERSLNPFEFKRGDAAALYSFSVVETADGFRVSRELKEHGQ